MSVNFSDPLDVLTHTLWGEARSTGAVGMRHVAEVILNRAAHPRWWGKDILTVCLAPWQFSCWNPHTVGTEPDANYNAMMAVSANDPWMLIAHVVAGNAIGGHVVDETGGADSFFAISMHPPPAWTARATHTMSDGWHSFWRTELPAPAVRNYSIHAPEIIASVTSGVVDESA